VPELAYRYAESMMLRTWLHWHPKLITQQEVRGAEIIADRDRTRPHILSFMHHHHYSGLFQSLNRAGAPVVIVMSPKIIGDVGAQFVQHREVVRKGSEVVPAVGGLDAIMAELTPGRILAIAPDLPGHTPITFLGREYLGSKGAAVMAKITDALIVPLTVQQHADGGHHLQVHAPIESRDYPTWRELVDATLVPHQEAILAWPEVLEAPRARYGLIEDDAAVRPSS
jgi:lauroyl/myristoyl acyltransferase